jgi:hypothetical protein
MIEHNEVLLAVGRAQSATDHLPVEAELPRRPRQNQAVNIWQIEAFSENHTIRNDVRHAAGEALQDAIALLGRRRSIDMLGGDASAHEFGGDVLGMRDVDREANGLEAVGALEPIGDDVTDQTVVIHALAELIDDIIARLHRDAAQIGRRRRVDLGGNEMAKLDQLGHLRAFDQGIEHLAESAAVASAWRCGEPDHRDAGVGRDDLMPCAGADVMALIDDDQIGRRWRHALAAHDARPIGLHRSNLHMVIRATRQLSGENAVRNIEAAKLVAGLTDDLAGMGEHQNMLIARLGQANDLSGDDGFAAAGRRHQADLIPPNCKFLTALLNGLDLIGPLQLIWRAIIEMRARIRIAFRGRLLPAAGPFSVSHHPPFGFDNGENCLLGSEGALWPYLTG